MFLFPTETEGFKIDTMGTYHGLSLEFVKVVCDKINLLSLLLYVKSTGQLNSTKKKCVYNSITLNVASASI